ncbi:MAG TPA: hypothetical protein VMD30_14375 [Tepidisphaeraceae bacterium]|nr:hypothetical protein [Tepidisphaeraceae bacterium]
MLAGCASSTVWPNDAVLDRFSAADVPGHASSEAQTPTTRNWVAPVQIPTDLPGGQLAQHPFLYAGEGYNMIDVVRGGKVVWTFWTGKGGEIDDVWMLSNGNVLFTRMLYVEEVTPEKKVVWRYDCPAGTQCHSVQPVGLDKVLVMRNGLPPELMLFNIRTNSVEWEHTLPAVSAADPKTVHTQFRHVRLTAEGTWLVSFLNLNKVVEYDAKWKPIFTYAVKSPWAALQLPDGDILISGDHYGDVLQVNRQGKIVWQLTEYELPHVDMRVVQGIQVLNNGNLVICLSAGSPKRGDKTKTAQVVEVTRDKKVVWVLQDWKDLGGASGIQLLDQPGIPEDQQLLR